MPNVPVSASEFAAGQAMATDMDTMMQNGASVSGSQVIPPVTNYIPGNTQVANFFEILNIISGRHGGSGGAFLSAYSSVGQGIPAWNGTGAPTQQTINYDRVIKDTVSGMVADNNNWVWTPGVAGIYHVETQLSISGQAGDIGDTGFAICQLGMYKVVTGGGESFDSWIGQGTHPMIDNNYIHGAGFIELPNPGDSIRIKMRQYLSRAQFITTIGGSSITANWIRIYRIGSIP